MRTIASILRSSPIGNERHSARVMKLTVQYRYHQPSQSFLTAVQQHLEGIAKIRRIDEARVLVEYREDHSPAFSVRVHLVTPGPDLVSEAMDHTLRAALRKAIGSIEAQLSQRELKRERRVRGFAVRSTPEFASRGR
jgi:ribosome-associated translation inhibitor RaiA